MGRWTRQNLYAPSTFSKLWAWKKKDLAANDISIVKAQAGDSAMAISYLSTGKLETSAAVGLTEGFRSNKLLKIQIFSNKTNPQRLIKQFQKI